MPLKWATVTLHTAEKVETLAKFMRNGDAHTFTAKISGRLNRIGTDSGELILETTDRQRYHYPIGR